MTYRPLQVRPPPGREDEADGPAAPKGQKHTPGEGSMSFIIVHLPES